MCDARGAVRGVPRPHPVKTPTSAEAGCHASGESPRDALLMQYGHGGRSLPIWSAVQEPAAASPTTRGRLAQSLWVLPRDGQQLGMGSHDGWVWGVRLRCRPRCHPVHPVSGLAWELAPRVPGCRRSRSSCSGNQQVWVGTRFSPAGRSERLAIRVTLRSCSPRGLCTVSEERNGPFGCRPRHRLFGVDSRASMDIQLHAWLRA